MRIAAIAKTTALGAALVAVPLMGALPAAAQEEDSSRLQAITYELAHGPNAGKIDSGVPLAMTQAEADAGVNLGFRVTNLDAGVLENVRLQVLDGDQSSSESVVEGLQCKVTSASGANGVDGAIGTMEPGTSVECTAKLVGIQGPESLVTTRVTADADDAQLGRNLAWAALVTEDGERPEDYRQAPGEGVEETVEPIKGSETVSPEKTSPGTPDEDPGKAVGAPAAGTTPTPSPSAEEPTKGVVAGTAQQESQPALVAGGLGLLLAAGAAGIGLFWALQRRLTHQRD